MYQKLLLPWDGSALLLALLMTLSAACTEKTPSPSTGDTSPAGSTSSDTSFPPHEHDTIDAPGGVWVTQAVIGALESSGLGPVREEGIVRLPFLGPVGTRLTLPGAEIQVYLYADALARARETDLIDSVKVAPTGGHVDWRMPASIIVINNAALIVLTSDNLLRRRIHAAVRRHDPNQGPS